MNKFSNRSKTIFAFIALVLTVSAANAQQPQFFANEKLNTVTVAQKNSDVADCMSRGNQFMASQSNRSVAGQGARSAARGAALGAVAGSITGNNAGRSAGAGAAVGGIAGTAKGVQTRGNANPDFQRFVNVCLEEKGYRVVNWR